MRKLLVPVVLGLVAVVVWLGWLALGGDGGSVGGGSDDVASEAAADSGSETGDVEAVDAGPVERVARRPRQAEPDDQGGLIGGRELEVVVTDEAGAPLHGVAVGLGEARWRSTDETGRARMGRVRPGEVEFRIRPVLGYDDPLVRRETVEDGELPFEVRVEVERPIVPVAVVRFVSDVPRRADLLLQRAPAPTTSGLRVPAGLLTCRLPLRPPHRRPERLRALCPGFAPSEVEVDPPSGPGDTVVELLLVEGGVPARGRVVEADGRAAAGVEVLAYERRDPLEQPRPVLTDADGGFTVDPAWIGRSLLAHRTGEACSEWTELTAELDELTLTLGPGAAVEGRVTFGSGRPAEGALVWVFLSQQFRERSRREIRTDADGGYRLAGLPEGWWVRPTVGYALPFLPAPDGPQPFSQADPELLVERGEAWITEGQGSSFRRDLVALRHSVATVTLRLRPPAGAALDPVVRTFLGEDDTWHELEPGTRRVEVLLWDGEDPTPVVVQTGDLVGRTPPLEFGDGRDRSLTVELTRRPHVVVQLVDGNGTAVARSGVEVSVGELGRHGGGGSSEVRTDARGRVDVTGRVAPVAVLRASLADDPGRRLVVGVEGPGVVDTDPSGDRPSLSLPLRELAERLDAASAGDVIQLDVPLLDPVELRVRTVDAEDRPVPGVRLRVRVPESVLQPEVVSDASGLAVFRALVDPVADPDTELEVEAVVPHMGSTRLQVGGSGEPRRLEVHELTPRRVRLLDPRGTPLAGLELTDVVEPTTTDADGIATLWLVAFDTYGRVRVPGFRPADVTFPEHGDLPIDVRLEPERRVWVRLDVPAEVTEPLEVRFLRETSQEGWLRCSAQIRSGRPSGGEATVSVPLADGSYEVLVHTPDQAWGGVATLPAAANELRVSVEQRRRHSVRFRLVDAAGVPTRDQQVRVGIAVHRRQYRQVSVRTDVTGELALDLYGDAYELYFDHGSRSGRVRLRVPEHAPPASPTEVVLRE